jgi:Ca2+-transporting ATPase
MDNLLTDGLPALALGVDPPAKDIMKRKPRKKNDGIINKDVIYLIFSLGIPAALIILALFIWADPHAHLERAQTMVFTAFVIFEMVKVYIVREKYHTAEGSNKWLHVAVLSSILLQLAVVYTPLNTFFKTIPLGIEEWVIIGSGMVVFLGAVFILQKAEKYIVKEQTIA